MQDTVTTSSVDVEAFIGQQAEPPRHARYAVSEAMIRNWVEACDDHNPVYVDSEAATATGRRDIICPPAMISTWVLNGYRRFREIHAARARGEAEDTAYSRLLAALDEAGFTSVVGTDVTQTYHRELHPGDRISCELTIQDVSPMKRTGLGDGHFITLGKRYLDASGAVVAEESFRMLRFKPAPVDPHEQPQGPTQGPTQGGRP